MTELLQFQDESLVNDSFWFDFWSQGLPLQPWLLKNSDPGQAGLSAVILTSAAHCCRHSSATETKQSADDGAVCRED